MPRSPAIRLSVGRARKPSPNSDQYDWTASVPLTGRTYGVGAARHRREPHRRAQTPVVAVRAFDTAGAKAGAERGCEKYQHGNPTRAAVRGEPRGCRVTQL